MHILPEPNMVRRKLDKGKWVVHPISKNDCPRIDPIKKIMYIPVGNTMRERFIRAHECAHVKYSPFRKPKDVEDLMISCTEDARINSILEERGIPSYNQAILPELGMVKEKKLVMFTIAANTCPEFDILYNALSDKYKAIVDEAMKIIKSDIYSFNSAYKAAKYLQKHLEDEPDTMKSLSEEMVPVCPDDAPPSEELYEIDEKIKDLVVDVSRAALGYEKYISKVTKFGPYSVDYPALPVSIRGYLLRRYKSSDEGHLFRNPDRYLIDKKIFGMKRRIMGGTIMIDGSGSMHLDYEDVKNLIMLAPMATIYIYGSPDSRKGVIKCLAREGHMVNEDNLGSPGMANVIDYHAINFMADKASPRILVCDGGFTGIGDSAFTGCKELCYRAIMDSKSYMVKNVGNAIEVITRLKHNKKVEGMKFITKK